MQLKIIVIFLETNHELNINEMSFLNILGQFALFNMICDLFSNKRKNDYNDLIDDRTVHYDHIDHINYCDNHADSGNRFDAIDDMNDSYASDYSDDLDDGLLDDDDW